MSDFRLRVFAAVARHLSFTKAGQELFVSQPAVTKHIRELEAQYGQRLLERRGNRVSLTEAGRLLHAHAEAVAASAQQLDEQLAGLRDPEEAAGRLRLGASTTLSQYVLPGWLPAFQARYPQVQLTLFNANSERIADALLRGELDLGFVEGRTKSRDLHYELLLPDELVAVRRATPAGSPTKPLPLAEALASPLVLRERGSGTLEVLEMALRERKIKLSDLQVAIYLDSTEAIKSYLEAAPTALGFVSRQALTRELAAGLLEVVPIAGLALPRQFEAVWVQGQPLPRPAQRFWLFAQAQGSVSITKGNKR
ncbi:MULTISPECIES: LysR substrate-binding domain-containing protein [Hymenobacter]|jgi:DNA-binding transcriptional LysR family regulator|uniref:LysR substrate-binding domain-containing protein n=1 Tax=Hymenobacter TaxID=89966 RepID=UPI0027124C54|nr:MULTISPECIES: LysR substrate-binding domain-containing protein [unclassified Hymenobacter]MDO7887747.1 LysR substrate-binding domain-containing protein [Hymenobacter sp. CA2-7]HET9504940.1 LysR substrate-binding domain-containing protein [Hymenobacter sp.]